MYLRQSSIIPTFVLQQEDENDMETMFDTLLQLPLFQGLAQEDFTCILEKVKLHFTKHKPGELLIAEGSPCHELVFVLKGEVASCTSSADSSYSFTEYFPAPCLLEAHSMFGMHTKYASSYRAKTEVHTVSISKSFAVKELFNYEIFRLNYMNIVSNRTQMLHNRLWALSGDTPETRILHFILSHTERLSGEKAVKIRMEDLAQIVNVPRTAVSKALNSLQAKDRIELRRGEIVIPDVERLV